MFILPHAAARAARFCNTIHSLAFSNLTFHPRPTRRPPRFTPSPSPEGAGVITTSAFYRLKSRHYAHEHICLFPLCASPCRILCEGHRGAGARLCAAGATAFSTPWAGDSDAEQPQCCVVASPLRHISKRLRATCYRATCLLPPLPPLFRYCRGAVSLRAGTAALRCRFGIALLPVCCRFSRVWRELASAGAIKQISSISMWMLTYACLYALRCIISSPRVMAWRLRDSPLPGGWATVCLLRHRASSVLLTASLPALLRTILLPRQLAAHHRFARTCGKTVATPAQCL